ncbi:hypothetical protein JCM10908_007324 [Rhodotorula pacifica]|uniref:Mid1p n=1 Tax=Rhodotorula pacifica TaxID=1495444 RepID=UPI0031826901
MCVTAKTTERIATPRLLRKRPPEQEHRRHPTTRSSFSWLRLVCLAYALIETGLAQTLNLTSPSTTTLTLGSAQSTTLSLPAPATFPLYISLSLCAIPSSLASNESFTLPVQLAKALYVSNSSSNPSPGPSADPDATGVPRGAKGDSSALAYGYANVTLGAADEGNVTVSVYAPDMADLLQGGDGQWTDETVPASQVGDRNEQWTFELSLSNGTEANSYFATGSIGFRLEDTDATSVLLAATNQSQTYTPVLATTSDLTFPLARSRCSIRRAMSNNVATPPRISQSLTSRGYGPGERTQFLISDLARGTNFTAWLVENSTLSDGSTQMQVYDPVFFATKNTDSCRLIFDVPSCPNVAYSVPAPRSLSTPQLLSFYNKTVSASLANFSRTLTTFPCDKEPYGLYSVVSKCSDCLDAYRDYVCAVTMPRCADAPPGVALNSTLPDTFDSNGDLIGSWLVPESYQTSLVRSEPFASRTPLFGPANLSSTFPFLFNTSSYPPTPANLARESPFPYIEIPPCLDVCNLVQARCPPFLGFVCPKSAGSTPKGGTGSAAWGQTQVVPATERLANDIYGSSLQNRAADRWGNVFCNALESDLTMALQFIDPFAKQPFEAPLPHAPKKPGTGAIGP